jgi:hypothetical protein
MKPNINMTWTSSEGSERGTALYTSEDTIFLSLDLPDFKKAHAIALALDTAVAAGYHEGVNDAQSTMNTALRNMK